MARSQALTYFICRKIQRILVRRSDFYPHAAQRCVRITRTGLKILVSVQSQLGRVEAVRATHVPDTTGDNHQLPALYSREVALCSFNMLGVSNG